MLVAKVLDVDLTIPSIGTSLNNFEKSAAYTWLKNNAYRYGFILSYPPNNAYYQFEPWHWRFVGIALATRLHNENKNFYNYCNKKATFLDYKYFVRNKHDIKNGLPLELYDFDENFTTSHDGILSKIIAYKELEKFLSHRITKSSFERESIPEKVSLLSWSASKSALIELLYALHQTKCFNSGNIEFSEIVHTAERVLNIKLGNFYKTIGEIKARKNGRTKFLQLLNDNLNQLFLESDQ